MGTAVSYWAVITSGLERSVVCAVQFFIASLAPAAGGCPLSGFGAKGRDERCEQLEPCDGCGALRTFPGVDCLQSSPLDRVIGFEIVSITIVYAMPVVVYVTCDRRRWMVGKMRGVLDRFQAHSLRRGTYGGEASNIQSFAVGTVA